MSRPSKKIAIMGAAAATASAVTVVMAAPKPPVSAGVALAATTGPYTQLITGSSGAVDNGLVFMGSAGGAGAAFWNPIAASSGGWLPTFTAQTTQNDLTTTKGLLNAVAGATELNVVPGISGDATTTVLAATAHTLVPVPGVTNELDTAADTVLVPLASVRQVIDALNALNTVPVVGGQLAGIPTVEGVLDVVGLTATQTTFESTFSWPLFGADGKTQIGNTFIQLPSLDASTLVDRIRDNLTVGGLSVPDAPPEVQKLVSDTMAPLDTIVSTPSVTAWIPAGSGSYHALGATLGFLAAAPIVAIGPVGALSSVPLPAIPGVPLNPASETAVAVPIVAYGADLPFGIAGLGLLTMPAVVTPAAVLVSPPLAVTYTRINTGSAPYVGPNGVYYNSGTTLGLLATSVGILPVMYSLGAISAGPTGAGVVGPSVFGIGVLPPVQVPTAQPLQALDGLNPAGLANPAGLVNPVLSAAALVSAGLVPAGVLPAGLVPAGLVPAGVLPAGVVPAQPLQALDGLNPAGLVSAGLVPAGVVPAGLVPAGLVPAGVVPAGLVPAQPLQALDGLNAAGLVNPGLVPAGVVPAGVVPTGLVPAQPLQALDGLNLAGLVNPAGLANPAGLVNPVLSAAALVNAGLVPAGVVPAQLTNAVAPLGLPSNGEAVTAAINPTLSNATATLGPLITKALNGSFGPAANEIARRIVALGEQLAEASQVSASTPNGSGLPLSPPPIASVPDTLLTSPAPAVPLPAAADLVEDINVPEDPQPRTRPRLNVITGTGNPGESALVGNSRTSTGGAATNAPGGLRSTVQNAPKRVTDAVSGTVKSVTDTVTDTVSGAVSGAIGSLGKLGQDDG